jgi:hypothetical protein
MKERGNSMFTYVKGISLGALLLLALCITAAAASKVAIIKVNSGSATLDGKTFTKAKMASEGQVLNIATGSQVRIQLLGSKHEMTVTGPVKLNINKQALVKKAKEVSRNSAAVAADIGNRNTVSASSTRGSADELTELKPTLPPQMSDGDYVLGFEAGDSFPLRPEHSISVEVAPLDGNGPRIGHTFTQGDPLVPLQMPPDLEPGRGYRFTLIYSDPGVGSMGQGSAMYKYKQTFRILTPDQEAFLVEAERELKQDYRTEKDILPLLRLASLYQEYDQNEKVLEYLKMAYDSEHLNDEEQWNSLRLTIHSFERSLTMPVPLGD